MPPDEADHSISIGGRRFDPLEEQVAQQNEDDDEPEDPDRRVAWIVQFTDPLDGDAIADLRATHALRLTDYLPRLSYLERLSTRQVRAVRADPRVRAVVRYLADFKLAPSTRRRPDPEDDEPAEAPVLEALLFPDADPDGVAADVTARGGEEVRVLDDRAVGGGLTVRFRLGRTGRLEAVARLEDVRWVEPLPETVDDDGRPGPPVPPSDGAGTSRQLHLHGEGQVIGIIDKGPPDLEHCFFRDDVNRDPGPGHRKVLQISNAIGAAASSHSTFTAGCAAGDDASRPGTAPDRGLAWAARLVCGNRLDLPNSTLLAELTRAGRAGAFVHSNSYHSRPQGPGNPATYDQRSADVDVFTWTNEDHLVLGSSGNSGEEQGPPGTAKNSLCVSCSSADPAAPEVGDGNPGPTADGRRKPDLTAPGCHARSAVNGTGCDTAERAVCASSFATPRAAAAAVIARQFFTDGFHPSGRRRAADAFTPSGALLKAVLVNAARRRIPGLDYPNTAEGWGHLEPAEVVPAGPAGGRRLVVVDTRNADGLTTGQVHTHPVLVAADDHPLKITLVWTEPPGVVGSDISVVNDLDLVVTAPDGTRFVGNAFADGFSVEGGTPDPVNNVETVLVARPRAGRWLVEVHAREVNVGGPGQGFAIVVTGSLAAVPP